MAVGPQTPFRNAQIHAVIMVFVNTVGAVLSLEEGIDAISDKRLSIVARR
jgi:hypothetical protein